MKLRKRTYVIAALRHQQKDDGSFDPLAARSGRCRQWQQQQTPRQIPSTREMNHRHCIESN